MPSNFRQRYYSYTPDNFWRGFGSRGREGIRRALMGSVSDAVVRHAHCPVMVVRPEKE